MPVVTPSRASTESVNAVPRRASLRWVICGRPELLAALAGQAEADQPARVGRHEVDGLRRRELRRADEIALVLALGIVDDDHHLPVPDVLDGLLDRRERGDGRAHDSLAATSRSTTFPSTSASRLTSSPGSSRPRVVTASVCGISATSKPLVVERGDGERDAVDRDRALLDAVAERPSRGRRPTRDGCLASGADRSGRGRRRRRGPARRGRRAGRRRAATARGSPRRRARGGPARSARASRGRRRRRAVPPSASTTVRQTPATATESPTAAPPPSPCADDHEPGAVEGLDGSELADDAREHAAKVTARAGTPPTARPLPRAPRGGGGARAAPRGRRARAARRPRGRARRRAAACRRGRRRGTQSRASGRPRAGATGRPRPPARAVPRRASPLRSSSSDPSGSGPRPKASRRGCRRGLDVARVEPRRVGAHRPHPDRDGVRGGPQLVHPPARLLARHPAAARDGDAAVERDRGLVRDERTPERLPHAPRLVLPARGEIVEELDLDPRGAKALEPAAVDDRVRVAGADDDARDPGVDHGVGAGRRAAVVGARLERHVEGRAARGVSGLLERDRLGVADSVVLVPALPHDLAVAHDDGADEGMVAGLAPPALGQLERPLEVAHPRAWTSPR